MSCANAFTERLLRCHPDTVFTRQAISIFKGGSAVRCHEACWPMMLKTGVRARRALCRLAMPLANPGPKCNRVMAGFCFIRPKPSAAPVQTPSKRPRTGRMPLTVSNAATSVNSVVPALAKHISTPASLAVFKIISAPFIKFLLFS